jgi:hypothetical protein
VLLHLPKNNELSKVAQLPKITQSCHPVTKRPAKWREIIDIIYVPNEQLESAQSKN